MPLKSEKASEGAALSALMSTSIWLASPHAGDENAASWQRPALANRQRATSSIDGHARSPSATGPAATEKAVLEAVFAKANKLPKGDAASSPLADKFRSAAAFSIGTTLVSSLFAAAVWKATAWAFPSSNAAPTAIIGFVGILYLCHSYVFQWLLRESEANLQSRVRGATAAFLERPLTAPAEIEAAHWLNDILDSIWPFINPDVFKLLTDVMEATIQDNCPPFVSAVSIESMGQGARPIRLRGIRRLPKQPLGEDEAPTSGEVFDDIIALKSGLRSRANTVSTNSKRGSAQELRDKLKMLRERTSVHMEVVFDYGCTERDQDNHKRIHFLLAFTLVGGIRVPVWVNMQKIVGCLRARVQLKPDPPFVSTSVISLMGKPDVQFSCQPLFKSSLNVMSMPLVSDLVRQALDKALAAYTSPRSISIDLGAILVGDATAQDVSPLGAMLLKVHRVYDVESKWADDDLCSFLSAGWAKEGNPLYIYRTINNCTSPRWEENSAFTIEPDDVNAQESLKMDFVRVGSLDSEECLGSLQVLLADLLSTPECTGKMQRRNDTLLCPEDQHPVAKLDWSIGFFPKTQISLEQLKRQTIYPPVKSREEFETRIEEHVRYKFREAPDWAEQEYEREKIASVREAELKIMNSQPPLQDYPSGILHVELPSMNFLSALRACRGTEDSEEMTFDDEDPDAPTSYANIYINQYRCTRTLIKPRDTDPAFGSMDHRFVRDWRTAEIIVTVRDKRFHKTDTLLGAVRITLADLFQRHQASRVQLGFPIEGGEGCGLANLTVLWRAIEMNPAPAMRSWQYGTLKINVPICDDGGTLDDLKHGPLTVCSVLEEVKLYPNHNLNPLSKDPQQLAWLPKDKHKTSISFPIKNKYSERLLLAWISKLPWKHDRFSAYAFLKLEDLVEHEETRLKLPVYAFHGKGKDVQELENDLWPETHADKVPMGYVELEMIFLRGLTSEHAKTMKSKDVDDIMDVVGALGPNPQLTLAG
ncbi:hypothetical protein D6D28_09155 [Lecanosticta acicola]|uniref:C2 domain-containing protein n=1 Tax=Lecanosticta acicola TaxID=111012 RepID=A0AAI9E9Z9_9PEZI|nr:hypothetical protein D6D28_09155 [Lecanosticta acicola]